ncbi:MAG: hypothetical protein OEY52_16350 [Gammaproteobacteria bacterium]|nr:hypothetical protein [Gammaproteobacteria bacterium]
MIPLMLAFSGLIIPVNSLYASDESTSLKLDELDKAYQLQSRDFYRHAIKTNLFQLQKTKTISALKTQVDMLLKAGKTVQAIALIEFNFPLLRNHIDAIETIQMTETILEHNHWFLAKKIYETAELEAGKVAMSNISFVFAKYYMARKDWQMALKYLKGIINELSDENADYARIMVGTILQYQKKHREAISYYQKVKKESRHYPAAVLNTAVAYIRQDWWTDAYVLVNDLIKNQQQQINDHMLDRLNLTIGYALLRKQYFRNSRDAFRNIGLNGPYSNRALLGLALTAANQEDYIGALNAITILKGRKSTDLSVEEAYLLLPYTYGKLKQNLTATSAYTDAIKYYQERISSMQALNETGSNLLTKISLPSDKTWLVINNNIFNYSRHYPRSFFDNYRHLSAISKHVKATDNIGPQHQKLVTQYRRSLQSMSQKMITERIEFLQSYLNQARYGLARLYDSTLVSTQ